MSKELINHPVHISDRNSISAFIPFCSFGLNVDLIGKKLSNFQVPVCSLFRKKIFSGQVCYEADINQFKNKISFIVDTNDEYDVKNLIQRQSSNSLENNLVFNSFKDTEDDNKFAVMLKTISKISEELLISTELIFPFSDPIPSLQSDGGEGRPSEQGVGRARRDGDSLSD